MQCALIKNEYKDGRRQTYTFSCEPVLPMTLHPRILANWPPFIPTAPDAADMNTLDPAFGFPSTSIPTHAANPGTPEIN